MVCAQDTKKAGNLIRAFGPPPRFRRSSNTLRQGMPRHFSRVQGIDSASQLFLPLGWKGGTFSFLLLHQRREAAHQLPLRFAVKLGGQGQDVLDRCGHGSRIIGLKIRKAGRRVGSFLTFQPIAGLNFRDSYFITRPDGAGKTRPDQVQGFNTLSHRVPVERGTPRLSDVSRRRWDWFLSFQPHCALDKCRKSKANFSPLTFL